MGARLRIGTRGSQLALWQARAVASQLDAHGIETALVVIRTAGDRLQEAPLSETGGKRLFVKEIEDALLAGSVDLAVHSAKDLPAVLPDGLTLAATLPREDPRDALVLPAGAAQVDLAAALARLSSGRVGTSSVRRSAQLLALVGDARFGPVRGNVDTRLRKLDEGQFDALVLASAGLRRLGHASRISAALPVDACVPALGQGIIAIEVRAADTRAADAVRAVNDPAAWTALRAEQAVVAALGGGCHLPLGALATDADGRLDVLAVVCTDDGRRVVRARRSGRPDHPDEIGRAVAADLEAAGAVAILDAARSRQGPIQGSY